MKVSLYQYEIVWEDKRENLKKLRCFLNGECGSKLEILLLPEMSFTGFSMHTDMTKESDNETLDEVVKLAKDYEITIGFGWVKDCGELCENHYTVVDSDGGILSDYTKIHPFSYSGEDRFFQGGREISFFELNGMVFSTCICYDLRFPEIFQLISKKADVIIVPANWPASRAEHWKTLLKARAIENQVYILGINCVGSVGGLSYTGDSSIISPNGDVLGQLTGKEGTVTLDLENDVLSFREAFPVKNDRREELYRSLRA